MRPVIYKYLIMYSLFYLLAGAHSKAQLFIEGNSILIQKGASIHFDGLTLTPAFAINLINKEITRLEVPMVGSPHASINRIYKIDSKTPFTGKIGLQYEPSELNGNDESLLQLAYGTENFVFTVPTNKSSLDINNHYLEEDVVSQELWAITATTSGSILPVKLISFTAMTNEKHVLISWTTSEETNGDYFLVQHSVDGKQWHEIGKVKATGESRVDKTYSFEHDSPVNGDNFYRLKMVDQDGSFALSRVRNIHYKGESVLTMHPNPVSDWLTVNASDWSSITNMKITNVAGLKMREFSDNQLRGLAGKDISVKDFPSGIYVISITKKDGSVHSEKIFKD